PLPFSSEAETPAEAGVAAPEEVLPLLHRDDARAPDHLAEPVHGEHLHEPLASRDHEVGLEPGGLAAPRELQVLLEVAPEHPPAGKTATGPMALWEVPEPATASTAAAARTTSTS